jgi:hypothetical protein
MPLDPPVSVLRARAVDVVQYTRRVEVTCMADWDMMPNRFTHVAVRTFVSQFAARPANVAGARAPHAGSTP